MNYVLVIVYSLTVMPNSPPTTHTISIHPTMEHCLVSSIGAMQSLSSWENQNVFHEVRCVEESFDEDLFLPDAH